MAAMVVQASSKTSLWHQRTGHVSLIEMQVLDRQGMLDGDKICDLEFCEHFVYRKMHIVKFSTRKHCSKEILEYVHSDLWGLAKIVSHGGNKCFVPFLEDYSRKWKSMVENRTDKKTKNLRTYNGLEFSSEEFTSYCKTYGLNKHRTIRNTPQKNGLAERMNKTLLERTRCILSNAVSNQSDSKSSHKLDADKFDLEVEQAIEKGKEQQHAEQDKNDTNSPENDIFLDHDNPTIQELDEYNLIRDREGRASNPPQRYGYADIVSYALHAAEEIIHEDPRNYYEATKCQDKDKWLLAMTEDLNSLENNNTWALIPKYANSSIIGRKWIFKRKGGFQELNHIGSKRD
ncbi:uncharacterized protein [Cicer arietinum]|uniref:Uncharacterized protein LOC105852509 n=1 Tax=Cicer arietinum TaxID=3827 RepID=A0A1S3EDE0_CICAR|nr:uncharacterized protein LOC105852509 [Cicer arietinum]